LFAKTGLLVRAGVVSELIVPDELVGRFAFQWSKPEPTDDLLVGPCSADSEWVVFPAGYRVAEVGCFEFIVRTPAGGDDRSASVGVGAPCPGQTGPQGDSDT
jgi:hypothetical protein